MHIDTYTKGVLTVIAFALVAIACKPIVHPAAVAAQNSAGSYQFVGVREGIVVVDQRANMWLYPIDFVHHQGEHPVALGKVSHLGKMVDSVDK